mmetsp:Transcript_28423/g.57457  ORF Transcript_28423/g.57457 Transcript_28423/m.57457 type:complete len:346 (-) Transcript_28423:4-1041(-)
MLHWCCTAGHRRYWLCALLCACFALLPHFHALAWSLRLSLATIPECPEALPEPEPLPEQRELPIHVVYSGDASFFPGLLHSMLSLARHLERPASCTIHVVVAREELPRAEAVVGCFRRELAHLPSIPAVELHELRPPPFDVGALRSAGLPAALSRMANPYTFVRFYVHEYLPAARRALWLDMDTIVKADVAPLFRMAMRHPVAAAYSTVPLWSAFWWRLHVPSAGEHFVAGSATFNAGVLVLDLQQWRSGDISRALAGWLNVTGGTYSDQAAFVLEFQGRFDVLDWRWNFYQFHMLMPRNCVGEARIVHYPGHEKPWNSKARPFKLFFEYSPRSKCSALNWTRPV